MNFLELCKQKNEDKLWMDEIAAMQVSSQPVLPYLRTSGIVLAGEDESTPSHASLDIGQGNQEFHCRFQTRTLTLIHLFSEVPVLYIILE